VALPTTKTENRSPFFFLFFLFVVQKQNEKAKKGEGAGLDDGVGFVASTCLSLITYLSVFIMKKGEERRREKIHFSNRRHSRVLGVIG